jgi:hypothetical protein
MGSIECTYNVDDLRLTGFLADDARGATMTLSSPLRIASPSSKK